MHSSCDDALRGMPIAWLSPTRRNLRAIILVASWLLLSSALAAEEKDPPAGSLTAAQLKSEIERLQRGIQAKRDTSQAPEAWKKVREAETRLAEARAASRRETDAIREEISKLTLDPAAARWGVAIDGMQRRLAELEIEDWKLTKFEGRRLFQARHAELSKFAPAATPQLHGLGFDVLNYPRMDGSTSCQPLAALIACRCFGARPGWVGKEQRRWRDPDDDETSDKGGLAYSVDYYERFMSGSPRTRTIAVNGTEPTFDTIRQRKYPYTAEVFAVTRKGIDPHAPAARLRNWLLSAEGQSVVRESGYVPLTRKNGDP